MHDIHNIQWQHLFDMDANGFSTRTVKLLVDVVTPLLLNDILDNAHNDNISAVFIDAGFPLLEGEGIRFADSHTHHDDIMVIEEKYRALGVTYAYFF